MELNVRNAVYEMSESRARWLEDQRIIERDPEGEDGSYRLVSGPQRDLVEVVLDLQDELPF